jgi:hypothetical protein
MSRDFEWYLQIYKDIKYDVEILTEAGVIEIVDGGMYNWTADKTSLGQFFKSGFNETPNGLWPTVAAAFKCKGEPITASQLKHLVNKNSNGDKPKKSSGFLRIQKILKLDRARRYLESVKQSGYKDSEKIYEKLKDFFNEKVDRKSNKNQ